MNSEVQTLVKLEYAHTTLQELLHYKELAQAMPALLWMKQEVTTVYNRLMYMAEPKKRHSWAKTVERTARHIDTMMEDEARRQYTKVTLEEYFLFLMSVVTQMLEDISLIPSKKPLVEDLLTAAYTLENQVKLSRKSTYDEDSVHMYAGSYLQDVYQKIAEMH